MKRLKVIYEGRVHGVGFRFTAAHLAGEHSITGYVKNLSDGTVELIVEGTEKEIELFQDKIMNSHLRRGISKYYTTWSDPTNEFKNFKIQY